MVIDDEVAQNDIEKRADSGNATRSEAQHLPIAKAAENILAGKYDSQRLFYRS